jgi:ribosomal protein S18 acetylase RimI-like enzyme
MSERRSHVPVSPSLLPQAVLLVERALAGTRYLSGALEALRSAVDSPGPDARAIASVHDAKLEALIVFGIFGGTSGAGRLHFVVVGGDARRAGVGAALVRAASESLEREGARLLLAELPDDDGALPGARAFLDALGFAEESRVDNFYREGLALTFMRRELGAR